MKFLAMVLSIALSGCSYSFVRTGDPPNCSSHRTGPIWDTVLGGISVLGTAVAVDSNQGPGSSIDPFGNDREILFGLGFSLLFLTSAYYGYSNTSECRSKMELHQSPAERYVPQRRFDDRRPHQRTAVAQHAPLRSTFAVGDWNVGLLGVPEAERDVVAVRIEARTLVQRFKGCQQLETTIDGAVSNHDATYAAKLVAGKVQEALFSKVRIETLAALATSSSSTLGMCGERHPVPAAAAAEIARFLDIFAARGGARGAPAPQVQPQVQPQELTLALVLDGQAMDLLGQPTLHPELVFVLLPGVQLDAPGCSVLGITVDGATTSMQLILRPGTVPMAYTTMDLSLLQRVAHGPAATLSICGAAHLLSVQDRAAVAAFTERFRTGGGPPPAPAPTAAPAAAPAPSEQAPPTAPSSPPPPPPLTEGAAP